MRYTNEDICNKVSDEEVVGMVGLASSKKGLEKRVICYCFHNTDISITTVIMYCQIDY